MSFICQNPTCAIAISKAAFPGVMNCPVCQQPLVELKEAPLLSEEDEELIASLPYVIAYPLKETLLQNDYEKRLHRLGYTFINFLKYLGLISISEFFNSDFKNRKIVDLFLSQLSEPSFGKWNAFIRESYAVLQKEKIDLVFPEFYDFYIQIENKDKKFNLAEEIIEDFGEINYSKKNGLSSIGMLIHFRNKYLGHGTPINEHKAKEIWDLYYPIFQIMLIKLIKIPESSLYKRENGIVWKLSSTVVREVNDLNQTIDEEKVWLADGKNRKLSMVPFFIIPSDFGVLKNETQLLVYESYTGNTIKFFSPENIIKETSGEILQRLNLLLRDKKKETPFTLETFTNADFLNCITEENKLLLDKLIIEKKIIPGVYWHREEMEIKLREWIGARANIFFIAAEAGSGKTNLLAEIQKQYTERAYPTLLIRAGRMEKITLKEQVAYLLNIDANEGLDKYSAITGTQAEPTFILIDGLNEAHNAEAIWQEIIEWSKILEPGSIKFVVTSRANTKADLERYKIEETDLNFLYGENKDYEKGLGAYAFWLTPLDMNEMKGAWENYVAKDKSRYKPLFSFDDIATFDRAIYNQINNPLVLRLFLEIYNGKNLPKKGGNHLHIWQDWFKTFSNDEQTFLKLLADEVWLKGANELLLDDLLNNEKLKPYLTSDLVNSPYARMKNLGWISRYVKDLNGFLGFTVEGALLYLMGVKLQQQEPTIDLSYIQNALTTGTKLQQSAIESFLCEQALAGDLDLVTELIDAGTEQMDLCIRPLLYFLKAFGVEVTISKVLAEPTENDWKALLKLDKILEELQLHILRKAFLSKLISNIPLNQEENILLLIKSLNILDKDESNKYFEKIHTNIGFVHENENLLFELANYYFKIGDYKKSIEINQRCYVIYLNKFGLFYIMNAKIKQNIGNAFFRINDISNSLINYNEALEIKLNIFGEFAFETGEIFNSVGAVLLKRKDYDKALQCFIKSNKIKISNVGKMHPSVANTYNNIGLLWKEKNNYEKALEYFKLAQDIREKLLGENHLDAASTFLNIGNTYMRMGDYNKALESHYKSLNIKMRYLPENHHSIGYSLKNIGLVYFELSEFENCLIYNEGYLKIQMKIYGEFHSNLETIYRDIAFCQCKLQNYSAAITTLKESLKIKNSDYCLIKIAECYETLGDKVEALFYFIKSAEIRKDNLSFGINNAATIESINNSIRLAKKLDNEYELPDWIKNYNRGGESE